MNDRAQFIWSNFGERDDITKSFCIDLSQVESMNGEGKFITFKSGKCIAFPNYKDQSWRDIFYMWTGVTKEEA